MSRRPVLERVLAKHHYSTGGRLPGTRTPSPVSISVYIDSTDLLLMVPVHEPGGTTEISAEALEGLPSVHGGLGHAPAYLLAGELRVYAVRRQVIAPSRGAAEGGVQWLRQVFVLVPSLSELLVCVRRKGACLSRPWGTLLQKRTPFLTLQDTRSGASARMSQAVTSQRAGLTSPAFYTRARHGHVSLPCSLHGVGLV